MHTRYSSSRSTRRAAAVGALIVLASSLLCLNAATINGRGVLIGPSFHAEMGDKVRVTVSNVGRRPIGVQVLLLDLTNFEDTILPGAPLILAPLTLPGAPLILAPLTSSFEDITLSVGLGIIAIIKFQSSGAGQVKACVQVIEPEPGGGTRLFECGFESGDTSRRTM